MRERIAELAGDMRRSFGILRERARAAREADASLVVTVNPAQDLQNSPANPETGHFKLSVCAVDGGLLAQRVHGADIVVFRAVGVNFTYDGRKLGAFAYHPSKSPEPSLELKNSLDEHEANVFRSLVRLNSELSCAISSLERFRPKLLLMDGSLLPLPSDRPESGSSLLPMYDELISLYSRLFSLSKEKKCMLCGVVKDSRARKLAEDLGFSCSDTLLCGYLLSQGERTRAMPYFEEKKAPSKDMLALGQKISVFYLKPSEHDLPLRIEAYDCDADEAASVILSLSSISENFAYPAVLIEADMCAALDPKEMEAIESSLLNLSGLKPLRRNSRPFR
jgi:hypothetical protein